jgi:predicted phosphodiesterase
MAIAIISDIHANLEALEAVLYDIECLRPALSITETHCLGDIVGYGPDPVLCVEKVQKECSHSVAGNHEDAVCHISRNVLEGEYEESHENIYNSDAIQLIEWTNRRIYATQPALFSYLSKLPFRNLPEAELSNIAEVHGTLCFDETEDDQKILKRMHPVKVPHDAIACGTINHYSTQDNSTNNSHTDWEEHLTRCFGSLSEMGRKICFIGHTHVMEMYQWNGSGSDGWEPVNVDVNGGMITPEITRDEIEKILHETGGEEIRLNPEHFYVINPGSVGQPRDGDRRASYCVYTGDSVVFRRVPYDYPLTMFKLLSKQGLNMETAATLATRLHRAH